jgi:Protein of unknown function (DUF1329)
MSSYRSACIMAALLLLLPGLGHTQGLKLKDHLDLNEFASSQVIHSDAQIPVGTKITMQNWQKYKDFMSYGMQTLFMRTTHWAMPDDVEMNVGPTTNMPLPKTFLEDTEKYGKQARLVPTADGSFEIAGYGAGMPFPHPGGPNAGMEILYDQYYAYIPYLAYNFGYDDPERGGWSIDRFGNKTQSSAVEVWFKVNHLSEPDKPKSLPGYQQYLMTQNVVVLSPEESKYTNLLQIFSDDPALLPETYVFVPALRRSLRLSSAARCSPAVGTDFTADDFRGMNIQPPIFTAKLISEQYIIAMTNQTPAYKSPRNYYQPVFWPKPNVGKWENRPVWVIDVKRVPRLQGGYCYSHRIAYIDRQTLQVLDADLWDSYGKFYKSNEAEFVPMKHPEGGVVLGIGGPGDGKFSMYDFQNSHASHTTQHEGAINNDVPKQYWDFNRYATPAGMLQVMQ